MKLSRNARISALAAALALSPQLLQKGMNAFGTSDRFISQHFTVIPNSVSSGSTFQVRDGRDAITVSLCGIVALSKSHPLETQARDRLQGLLDRGNGSATLIPVKKDGTQMVAEAFILLPGTHRELHLNAQRLAGGLAKANEQTIDTCPNSGPMQRAAGEAIQQANGIWAQPIDDSALAQ